MNNEEKILSILEAMQGSITTMQGSIMTMRGNITTMQGNITTMQGDITTMQGDITTMQGDITKINNRLDMLESEQSEIAAAVKRIDRSVLLIENEHGRKIGALFDGYQASLDRDKAIEPRVTKLERTTDRLGLEMLALRQAK